MKRRKIVKYQEVKRRKIFSEENLNNIKVSKVEIEALLNIYKTITKNQDRMDRLKFRDVLHNSFDMTDDMLMDRG